MDKHFPVLSGSYENNKKQKPEKVNKDKESRVGLLKRLGRKALPYFAAAGSFFAVAQEANAQKGDKVLNDATYTQLKNNEGKVGVQEGDTVHVLKVKQKRDGKKIILKEKGDIKILNEGSQARDTVSRVEERREIRDQVDVQRGERINIGGVQYEVYRGQEPPVANGKVRPGFTFQNGKWYKEVSKSNEQRPATNNNLESRGKITIAGVSYEEYHGAEPPVKDGLPRKGFLLKNGVWYKAIN